MAAMAGAPAGASDIAVTTMGAGWPGPGRRAGVFYHPRVAESRALADRLAEALTAAGAEPLVTDAWQDIEALDGCVEGVVGVEGRHAEGGDAVAMRDVESRVGPRLHAEVHDEERARAVHHGMQAAIVAIGGHGHRITSIE